MTLVASNDKALLILLEYIYHGTIAIALYYFNGF